jgi:hypothetical protein
MEMMLELLFLKGVRSGSRISQAGKVSTGVKNCLSLSVTDWNDVELPTEKQTLGA